MGMTIDEHKEHLLDMMDSMPDDACGDWRDSLSYAIDTMRKYQQIEEIYKNWCYPTYFNATDAMNKLGEVLKDGMTIGRILDFILRKHTEAVLNPSVKKPYAWAIYQTWKWVDENEKPREVVEDGKID